MGHCVDINQPTSTDERISVAQERLAALSVGDEFVRLVDLVEENNFHEKYSCWPFRWYAMESGASRRLTTIAQPRASGYNVGELVSWITEQVLRS